MKVTLFCLALLVSAQVLANTAIVCDETQARYGYFERFFITLDSNFDILKIDAANWNSKTNKRAGFDADGTYDGAKALRPKAVGQTLVYKFANYNEVEDGKFGWSHTSLQLPASLRGLARVFELHAGGGQGNTDNLILNCK